MRNRPGFYQNTSSFLYTYPCTFYLLTNCDWTVTSNIERCDHKKLCVWMFTDIKYFPPWKTKPNIFKLTNYVHTFFVTQEQEGWNYRHLWSHLWDPRKCQREIKKILISDVCIKCVCVCVCVCVWDVTTKTIENSATNLRVGRTW